MLTPKTGEWRRAGLAVAHPMSKGRLVAPTNLAAIFAHANPEPRIEVAPVIFDAVR